MGSEDGNKEIRQAEQLAAMGKISELIGKRSAAVTGEATVEVQTTSQQLHTAYVKSGAEHSQGGAEINRDEIPVALQPYVQQYFDQLRKQPRAAGGQEAVAQTCELRGQRSVRTRFRWNQAVRPLVGHPQVVVFDGSALMTDRNGSSDFCHPSGFSFSAAVESAMVFSIKATIAAFAG